MSNFHPVTYRQLIQIGLGTYDPLRITLLFLKEMESSQYSLGRRYKDNVYGLEVEWSARARTMLEEQSRIQGVDIASLKAVTEHYFIQVALGTQSKKLYIT